MSLKIKKNTPLIDQHDKNFMYGGKFGGNFINKVNELKN